MSTIPKWYEKSNLTQDRFANFLVWQDLLVVKKCGCTFSKSVVLFINEKYYYPATTQLTIVIPAEGLVEKVEIASLSSTN